MWPWNRDIERLREAFAGALAQMIASRGSLEREISDLKAELRAQRTTIDALLIAKSQAQAGGAGLAGMLREAADEAAEMEDEAAEAAREEADAFAEFLKKYEKDDLDG